MDPSRSVRPVPVPSNTTSYPSSKRLERSTERLVAVLLLVGTVALVNWPSTAVIETGGTGGSGGASTGAPAFWSTICTVETMVSASVSVPSRDRVLFAGVAGSRIVFGARIRVEFCAT